MFNPSQKNGPETNVELYTCSFYNPAKKSDKLLLCLKSGKNI